MFARLANTGLYYRSLRSRAAANPRAAPAGGALHLADLAGNG